MQIGTMNPVNFKGTEQTTTQAKAKPYTQEELQSVREAAIQKAKNNVTPLTCVLGAGAGFVALKKSSKAVGFLRSLTATGLELVTNFAVKHAPGIKEKEKLSQNVSNFFKRFTNEDGLVNKNIESWEVKFKTITNKIFGAVEDEDGLTAGDKLLSRVNNDLGVALNPRSGFDSLVGAGIAKEVADIVSDTTEEIHDERKANSAVKDFIRKAEKIAEQASVLV